MEKKFYVIGGQYEPICYGGSDTLRGARCLATRHKEYWDNWQGWHKPRIYRAEDTQVIEAKGMITVPDGWEIRVSRYGVEPVE